MNPNPSLKFCRKQRCHNGRVSMTEANLTNRFNFSAALSSNGTGAHFQNSTRAGSQSLPGSYIRDDSPEEEELQAPEPERLFTPPPQPNREKTCRICLSGQEEGTSFSYVLITGRLISPCRCRGTMKFVHLSCLNSWRYSSPNAKSVYQCDQCKYKYDFNRTKYAAIIGSFYTRVFSPPFLNLTRRFPSP